MSKRGKKRRARRRVDWEGLLFQLPAPLVERCDRILRRALKRRLERIQATDLAFTPPHVRGEAVRAWRLRYMPKGTKNARKRANYKILKDDPTYVQVERELASAYWNEQFERGLARPGDVKSLSFDEVCETYKAIGPGIGSTALDSVAREVLIQAYKDMRPGEAVREGMTNTICAFVRTAGDLGAYAGSPSHPFGLQDLVSEDEVVARVRRQKLVPGVLRRLYGRGPTYLLAREEIVRVVSEEPTVAAMIGLVQALAGQDTVTRMLERLSKKDASKVESYLASTDFVKLVAQAVLQNPRYARQFRWSVELRLRVRESVPVTPMEAYPLARTMLRKFVLHVGPTNSGKTHDALVALAAAESGAYLGPLRLLAFEQFDRLNREGCVCSLLTGEEATEVAGARHVSSTVEMANFYRPIDVAVIDEAQMMADPSRGHHWTAAILGIPARQVHVCCAPQAEWAVTQLVALCEDELEVVRHERLVPLRQGRGSFQVPRDVRAGDALVVFSRRSVHAVAAQVAAAGFRPSIIYGALPHDVRHEEARRFDAGETDVVVATDAIGMGMNLPIRRIVFVEQDKFDGRSQRLLRPEEVQQIAGRAGRFGRYDVGYFQSTCLRKEMGRRFAQQVASIDSVPVGIPADIALVRDATLSDCIRQWVALDQPQPFRRIGVSRDLALVGEVEACLQEGRLTNTEDKLLVLRLATMAFDERDKDLHALWHAMVEAEVEGRELELDVPASPRPGDTMAELEQRYRVCDLLYAYAREFGHQAHVPELDARRTEISHAIMDMLAST